MRNRLRLPPRELAEFAERQRVLTKRLAEKIPSLSKEERELGEKLLDFFKKLARAPHRNRLEVISWRRRLDFFAEIWRSCPAVRKEILTASDLLRRLIRQTSNS